MFDYKLLSALAAVVEQGSYGATAAGPIVYKVLEYMLQEKD